MDCDEIKAGEIKSGEMVEIIFSHIDKNNYIRK
jgi:hypothetical protein